MKKTKLSCNGCRVLRQGCDENCFLKSCIDWIPNPDSQCNATLFLTRFYGRAAFFNLINAAPEGQGAAVVRSLLYDACGRIIDPVYGSLGLMLSGKWSYCEDAVKSVFNGSPIMELPSDNNYNNLLPQHQIAPLNGTSTSASTQASTGAVTLDEYPTRQLDHNAQAVTLDPTHDPAFDDHNAEDVTLDTQTKKTNISLELTLAFHPTQNV